MIDNDDDDDDDMMAMEYKFLKKYMQVANTFWTGNNVNKKKVFEG